MGYIFKIWKKKMADCLQLILLFTLGKLNYREFCTLMHSRKEKNRKKSEQETANTPNASTSKSAEPKKN